MIQPLSDSEISAAVQKSGWVMRDKNAAKEFHALAEGLTRAIERKSNELRSRIPAGYKLDRMEPTGNPAIWTAILAPEAA